MASQLTPYLVFSGDAREAMGFYRDVFGGELALNTFGEFGSSGPEKDRVMHSQLETEAGYTLMGSDTPDGTPGPEHKTVCLSGDDLDRLRGYWEGLSREGEVVTPLEKQMWGDFYGECRDRFGVSWMVNIAGVASDG